MQRVMRFLVPYKGLSALLILALIIELAFETLLPLSFKFIIDNAIIPGDYTKLVLILSGLLTGAILVTIAGISRDFLSARMGTAIIRDMNVTMYEHLQKLSMDFYARTKSANIVARFNSDLSVVENFLMLIPYGILSVLGLVLNVVFLFVLQWKLALLATIALPLCLLGPKLLGTRASDKTLLLKETQAQIAEVVQENTSAQPVLKAFNLERSSIRSFHALMTRYTKISANAHFFTFLVDRSTNIGIIILNLIVICSGSILAFQGYLSIGSLLAFNAILLSISNLLGGITWLAPQLIHATAGMQRVEALLEEAPIHDTELTPALMPLRNEIRFTNVTFGYTPDHQNLKQINLVIPKGSYAAFVGSSGSGKSTIINLLMRFYEPSAGAISFDDVNIHTMSLSSLRSQIGIVFQDSFLFNTSILENIRMGKPDASDQEIEDAARAAEIHDIILSFPEGYDTCVGERGSKLSGGQRQRIAIARAIIRNPSILILDEATSALDPATETAINRTLQMLAHSRTVISITHRLASAEHADCIFVLHQGQLIEQGTHQELLALPDGTYRDSWDKQNGFQMSDNGFHVEIKPEKLRRIPILSTLDDELLDEISHYFVTESYAKDRIVLEEGDLGDKFYIIVRGKVEVLKNTDSQEQKRLALLSDGDFFGEIALLQNVRRTASIRSVTPVILLSLRRELFQRVLKKAPHLQEMLQRD
ncbi:ATP-binding cassette domain-containing protein [Aneurinibacillus soli]|nr:ATP-binding cassette domain-containing protein [Aneurinibacillus soli]